MDSNMSIYSTLFTLEAVDISPTYILPSFFFGTLTYCAIMFFNITLLLTIALSQKLHKPMYILLFNMPVNDMVGASALLPHMMSTLLSQNRSITYSACYLQAFLIHFYGTGSLLILGAMAYDRYIAICCPLKYNTVMSPNKLLKIILTVWTTDAAIVGSIIALNYRQEFCTIRIADTFCNNPSLMKLICGDTRLNNYYGLSMTILLNCLVLFIISFTYIHILVTCVSKRQSDAKTKAIQTCGTHLVVYLCFVLSSLFALISHRFDNVSKYLRAVFGASVMIFPPFLNPIIYGLKTKEIQQNIQVFFCKRYFNHNK